MNLILKKINCKGKYDGETGSRLDKVKDWREVPYKRLGI